MFILKTLGTVLFSGLVAYGGCVLVNLGYDWGYIFANRLVTTTAYPCCSNQGQMAVMSLQYIIFPLIAFWSMGYLTRNEKNVIWPLLLGAVGTTIAYYHLPFVGSSISEKALWPGVAVLTAALSFIGSRRLFKFLQFRMNPAAMFTPVAVTCVAAFACMVFYLVCDWQLPHNEVFETGLYAVLLAAVGYLASRAVKPSGTAGGAFAGFLAALPILVANAMNIGGNLLSLGLDHFSLGANLGYSALASSCMISMAAILACTAGGALYSISARN
jgi:hypothetical protein